MRIAHYIESCYKASALITRQYSTSFSLATSLLENEKRKAVYAIYGFVRLADEIVDSFHDHDKVFLLNHLEEELEYALKNGISTNPLLASFTHAAQKYQIERAHINAFMASMRADLTQTAYTQNDDLDRYIYGSANVVGLMCLKVFCDGDSTLFSRLEHSAQKLGSAFQKVNFLRDLKDDTVELGRSYFSELADGPFGKESKQKIEQSIDQDFSDAWKGLIQLPGRSRLAVALAYYYYKALLQKIKKTSSEKLLSDRVRISNLRKYLILLKVSFLYKTKQL